VSINSQPIPVIVVTGFLGSGKTTLLQRLLRQKRLIHTAVVINELGEIGIDHHIVRQISENVVLLPNGCLCCKVRDDLGVTLRELLQQSLDRSVHPLKRVIIETTGLADPVPIIHTLNTEPIVDEAFRLQSIVTTLDAVNAHTNLCQYPESLKQAGIADRLIITKTDIADLQQVASLHVRLRQINPAATIEDSQSEQFDLDSLAESATWDISRATDLRRWLNEEAYDNHDSDHQGKAHRHDDNITATCIAFDEVIDWTAFTIWLTMLLYSRGNDVLRIKGLINVKGQKGPVLIQGVQHIVSPPVHLENWPDSDRRSRLVFIARGIGDKELKTSLSTFNEVAKALSLGDREGMQVQFGAGTAIGGRPYRRAAALRWLK
jgi:G3E family GTPase